MGERLLRLLSAEKSPRNQKKKLGMTVIAIAAKVYNILLFNRK